MKISSVKRNDLDKKLNTSKSFRLKIDSLTESIVGKNPHNSISGPAWTIKHKIVLKYIETYVIENNVLPSGIHYIKKFKGKSSGYPGPIGNKGFINFDDFI
mgnify:FL=1|tara:strand:+ start:987 stop:1289 length:303 start_codon:yes stop_codon:yes gene_type:complete